jgi:hypothetical protein
MKEGVKHLETYICWVLGRVEKARSMCLEKNMMLVKKKDWEKGPQATKSSNRK